MLGKEIRLKLDIARLVNTMDVTKPCSNAEVRRNRAQRLVHLPNVLRLCIERVVINVFVVNTILLAASNSDLHFKLLLPWCGAGQVLSRRLDVVLNTLLRQVDHVAAEERNAVLCEEGLVRI